MSDLVLGTGYLGAALAVSLLADVRRVVGLDNGFATDLRPVQELEAAHPKLFTLVRGDLRNPRDVERAFAAAEPVDSVYLLAAQASAADAAAPPEYTEETNLRAPRLVLDAALRHGKPPVVYGSSFHVYGHTLRGTVDEATPYGAQGDLAHLSKLYAEQLGQLYTRRYGLCFAPVRLGVVYGPGPVMKRDLRFVTVPHAFSIRALAGQSLVINPSGMAPLGFVHLDEAIAALRLAAPTGEAAFSPANAVGEVATVADVASAVQAAARQRGMSVEVEAPDAPPVSRFRTRSRLEALGWRTPRRLAEAIGEVLDYYAAHSPPPTPASVAAR